MANNRFFIDIVNTPEQAKCDYCGEPAIITYASDSDEGHRDEINLCKECDDAKNRRIK